MGNLRLERVEYCDTPELQSFDDYTIFQTIEWVSFISEEQKAEPVFLIIRDGNKIVGRFTGLILKKFGLRILGSPFPGWTTSYMGFNLKPSISRIDALLALRDYAFSTLKCVHLEIMDRNIDVDEIKSLKIMHRVFIGREIDLSKEENTILSSMKKTCRWSIRKSEREGVLFKITNDLSFVDNFYDQIQDVFAKRNLVPTYTKDRVYSLVKHLLLTKRLLLVQAVNREGVCIATGIYPALNGTMYSWASASYRAYQHLQPNEGLRWFAMKYWKANGMKKYDMGGGGDYKKKFGGHDISIPWIRFSKYPIYEYLRNQAKAATRLKQKIQGLGKK